MAAKAHYEPGEVVINLTKRSGPGSLAHEWFHALDNYFARLDKTGETKPVALGKFASEDKSTDGKMRFAVRDAWRGIRMALSKGTFAERSEKLDEARDKPYYSQTIEKAARAFERYVAMKLGGKEITNDYLVNLTKDHSPALPTKAEMDGGITQVYDQLFNTLDTKETEKGVALYAGQPGMGGENDAMPKDTRAASSSGQPSPSGQEARALKKGDVAIYHWSDTKMDKFDLREQGTWFTTNPVLYQLRATASVGNKVVITPAKLNLATRKQAIDAGLYAGDSGRAMVKKLKQQGYDGVKMSVDGDTQYLLFDVASAVEKSSFESRAPSDGAPDSLHAGDPMPSDDELFAESRAAEAVPGQLSPGDALFRGPVVAKVHRRLFEGAADTLEKTAGLVAEGKALRKWRDDVEKFAAQSTQAARDFQRAMGEDKKRITAAEKQVDEYYRLHEAGDRDGAERYRGQMMSADGRAALRAWEKATDEEYDRLTGLNYTVRQRDGTVRPIGKVQHFHPRSPKPEFREAIMDFVNNPQGAKEVIDIMLKWAGENARPGETPAVTNAEQVISMLRREWSDESDNDLHGSTERARELQLPHQLYDYSAAARSRYLMGSAARRAQVANFGQAGRKAKENFWNKAISRTLDERTAAYLAAVRDSVYGVTKRDAFHKLMAGLNGIATGTMLSNPITISTNLLSGMTYTAATFGSRNSTEALRQMMRDEGAARRQAEDMGVVNYDLMDLYHDAERMHSSVVRKIHAGTAAALKYSGFNLTEEWVRIHNMLTAKLWLGKAMKAHSRDSNSKEAQIFTAQIKRLGVDPGKLYREGGKGEETDRFLRQSVREVQGGYLIDQTQPFMDSAIGKFLFKFQKWGAQQTRHFIRNVLNPALAKDQPRDVKPLMRYMLMTIGLGLGLSALKEWLFGMPDRTASLDEIASTWKDDEVRAIALTAQKLWSAQIASGAYGLISNYVQLATDVAERSRFKSPLEPPGVASVTNTGELLLRAIEQKTLTAGDVDDFLRAQIALYRTTKASTAKAAAAAGVPVLANERARQNAAWLSSRTRRFADEVGVEANRTSMGRIGKTETSPEKTALLNALRTGDVEGAKKTVAKLTVGQPIEQKKRTLDSLGDMVRAAQPVKVGVAGEARRELFLNWAKRRLPAADLARIQEIDATYRKTAERAGLFTPRPVTAKAMQGTIAKLPAATPFSF